MDAAARAGVALPPLEEPPQNQQGGDPPSLRPAGLAPRETGLITDLPGGGRTDRREREIPQTRGPAPRFAPPPSERKRERGRTRSLLSVIWVGLAVGCARAPDDRLEVRYWTGWT